MKTFTGRITDILPIAERGEWKSQQFRVEELEGQYPEAMTFTKSAKGDSQKYVDDFEKYNKVGDVVTVEYKFKSFAWKEKFINEVVAGKVSKESSRSSSSSSSSEPLVKEEQYISDNGQVDDDLPF